MAGVGAGAGVGLAGAIRSSSASSKRRRASTSDSKTAVPSPTYDINDLIRWKYACASCHVIGVKLWKVKTNRLADCLSCIATRDAMTSISKSMDPNGYYQHLNGSGPTDRIGEHYPAVISPIDGYFWVYGYQGAGALEDRKRWCNLPLVLSAASKAICVATAAVEASTEAFTMAAGAKTRAERALKAVIEATEEVDAKAEAKEKKKERTQVSDGKVSKKLAKLLFANGLRVVKKPAYCKCEKPTGDKDGVFETAECIKCMPKCAQCRITEAESYIKYGRNGGFGYSNDYHDDLCVSCADCLSDH
jgi:hypothetical protein